ncbi:MerR family transcriptional regulator [Streptomyces sp. NPDC002793]|uniref:helix-turn-helix domain-containing protein n=1 Tax=Streptomyces sp. NPDC002793 TaxID=3154432 RepID=UPI0033299090
MAWSTSQLAELAGTTLKTVRHYHEVGLLDEPERAPNGYKQYRISHLVRLLRIRRLVDLGVPLSAVPSVEGPADEAEQTLRALDAELAANIARQERMRRELAAILENRAWAELPQGFEALADNLPDDRRASVLEHAGTEGQRSFVLACSSILTPSAMSDLQDQFQARLSASHREIATDFDTLPEDAPEDVRQRLAERLAPEVRRQQEEYPSLQDLDASSRREPAVTRSVVVQALVEFYSRAQLDVLRRLHLLLAEGDGVEA